MGLFDRMEAENLVDTVFYDGSIQDRETFMYAMKDNFLCVVEKDKNPIAFFWLTDRQARRAQFHFCFFKEARGYKSRGVGRFILYELIKADFLDCIVGYIPKFNHVAIQYLSRMGVVFAGEIPHGIFNHKTGESEPCYLVYFDLKKGGQNGWE